VPGKLGWLPGVVPGGVAGAGEGDNGGVVIGGWCGEREVGGGEEGDPSDSSVLGSGFEPSTVESS
jgi:hypothetical protein